MRRIVAGLFMSLDGVVEAPETWHFPYFNDEMGQIVSDQMEASDTMLLGRRTYEEFAAFWPNQGDDVPLANEINGVVHVAVDIVFHAQMTVSTGRVAPVHDVDVQTFIDI